MKKYPKDLVKTLNSSNFRFSSRVVFGTGLALSTLCGSVVIVANTVGLKWTRSYLQATRNDVPLVPSPHLRELSEKVATDLKLSKSETASVKFVCSSLESSDVFGSLTSGFGALIGIPSCFLAESIDKVDFDMRLDGEYSEEETKKEATKFKENSVLSDAAKCYIIAEGLELCRNSNHFTIPAFGASSGTGLVLSFTSWVIRKMNIFEHGILLRNGLYLCMCTSFGIMYLAVLSRFNIDYNFQEIVNRLSEKYIDGGIEFYEHVTARCEVKEKCYLSLFERIDVMLLKRNAIEKIEKLKTRKQEFSQSTKTEL